MNFKVLQWSTALGLLLLRFLFNLHIIIAGFWWPARNLSSELWCFCLFEYSLNHQRFCASPGSQLQGRISGSSQNWELCGTISRYAHSQVLFARIAMYCWRYFTHERL